MGFGRRHERYPDTQLIDVVNEPPPHTTPVYTAALGGAGSSGYDWIARVFEWAHQYCPNSILILNDYNNIEYAGDNRRDIDIVNKNEIASQTGLPVYISGYDINIADDNKQKHVMQSQFTMFWYDNNIDGITVWGISWAKPGSRTQV